MKLIGAESSRIVVAFSSEEIRPEGGLFAPDFIKLASERYSFVYPPNLSALNGDLSALTFKIGRIIAGARRAAIREFMLTDGGIVVDADTSDDAELFADDFIAWATQTFSLRRMITPPRVQFLSTVIVEFDVAVEDSISSLASFSLILTEAYKQLNGVDSPARLFRLAFGADPLGLPANTMRTDFQIERRANVPFARDRYYCLGPFRTADLARLLEQFERTLLDQATLAGSTFTSVPIDTRA